MYDTVFFKITGPEVGGVDFLSEIPCHLERVSEHNYNNGYIVIKGDLDGLNVSVSQYRVTVKGSLCKFYLGDNLQTLGRGDSQKAIERLSDALHLPIDRATVQRLDVGQNLMMKNLPEVYLNHLGLLAKYTRCPMIETGTLYYTQNNKCVCFYDKVKECKKAREPIPELYRGKNVLRYEIRYMGRIPYSFNVPEVTGGMLYDERFYIQALTSWKETYFTINKINDKIINLKMMKTKREFYRMGVLALIERVGGEVKMIALINEALKRGDITKQQAHDLREVTMNACKEKSDIVTKNECIAELDKRVVDAIKYYR